MELENMDKAYSKSKKALDKSGKLVKSLDALKKDVKKLSRQIENIQIEIIRAKEDGDKAKVKALNDSLKAPQQQLQAKKQQLQKLEATVQKNQATVDEKMVELSQDPALKAHLNEVIGKNFSKKLTKMEKDKEEKAKQNEPLSKIQEAAKKDPNVMYSLKEIEKYTKLVSEAQAIISDKTKTRAEKAKAQGDLPVLQTALDKSRSALAAHFKGTISRNVIDKITSYEDLGKEIKSNNRYMKGLDKQIANYTTALQNIGYEMPSRDGQSSDRSDDSSSTTRTSSGRAAPSTRTTQAPTPKLPAEQPKWYQFVKRFKNWNARRKAGPTQEQEPAPVSQEDKDKFKNSMKYKVVRDYEEKMAADLLKQAKAQNRQTVDNERDNDKEQR